MTLSLFWQMHRTQFAAVLWCWSAWKLCALAGKTLLGMICPDQQEEQVQHALGGDIPLIHWRTLGIFPQSEGNVPTKENAELPGT